MVGLNDSESVFQLKWFYENQTVHTALKAPLAPEGFAVIFFTTIITWLETTNVKASPDLIHEK